VFAVAALIYFGAMGALLIGRYGSMKSARA
jgi:hypothetical protein